MLCSSEHRCLHVTRVLTSAEITLSTRVFVLTRDVFDRETSRVSEENN